ncbi:hypothetical protein IJF85_00530 [Candidatus Saccharibacteria bacterium]|nr:hypothetical protein [Candidatus Saccharibacteria bacterium]MBQ3263571.1 hypothetical protein [Candidatus Saccharibacteria bacterium]
MEPQNNPQSAPQNPAEATKTPAPSVAPPLENHTPATENHTEKPAEPVKPKSKDQSNKNNYILAGISVGTIVIIIALICGAVFGGWFNGGVALVDLFGSGISGGIDLNPVTSIKTEVNRSAYGNDSNLRNKMTILDTAIKQYQTNNRGALPTITTTYENDEDVRELYVSGYDETPLNNFYNNYLGDNYLDARGRKISLDFHADYSKTHYYEDPSTLNYVTGESNTISVFYKAACTSNGIVPSSGSRDYVIIGSAADYSTYFCIGSNK